MQYNRTNHLTCPKYFSIKITDRNKRNNMIILLLLIIILMNLSNELFSSKSITGSLCIYQVQYYKQITLFCDCIELYENIHSIANLDWLKWIKVLLYMFTCCVYVIIVCIYLWWVGEIQLVIGLNYTAALCKFLSI